MHAQRLPRDPQLPAEIADPGVGLPHGGQGDPELRWGHQVRPATAAGVPMPARRWCVLEMSSLSNSVSAEKIPKTSFPEGSGVDDGTLPGKNQDPIPRSVRPVDKAISPEPVLWAIV